jgi:UDP-glucose 4-epimerase
MHILVTGGAGYLGSVVTEELLNAGQDVIIFDNLAHGHRAAVHPAATFVHGDLGDRAALERTFTTYRGIKAVIHLAMHTSASESWQRPERYLHENLANGVNLMATAVRHDIGRFILASSADVCGGPGPVPIIEQAPSYPVSPYSESLYLLERALSWYERCAGLRYAVLRCFNVAGATERCGEHHVPETHLIPGLLNVALGWRSHVTLFGDDYPTPDGTTVRDYVHVRDVARAMIGVLAALEQRSRIYNVGAGQGSSTMEVIMVARRVTGHALPCVVEPRRPYEPIVQIAATQQIRAELGWEPRYSDLEGIIESAWAWQRRHPYGYDSD